jgi:hypothetical protein
MAQVQDAAQL